MNTSSGKLTDAVVHQAIETVFRASGHVTGQAVRAWLKQTYGQPGGVERVYRAVKEFTAKFSSVDSLQLHAELDDSAAKIEDLTQQLASVVSQLEEAVLREEAHSARWLRQIDELKLQVREVPALRRQVASLQDDNLRLRRELMVASDRLDSLRELRRDQVPSATEAGT